MSESALPLSLQWVPLFVESTNRALGGDIVAAELEERTDPLQWVLVLTSSSTWLLPTIQGVRELLKTWSSANDAQYVRMDHDGRTLKALLVLRGLGPEKKINPFKEDDAQNRRARNLDYRRKGR